MMRSRSSPRALLLVGLSVASCSSQSQTGPDDVDGSTGSRTTGPSIGSQGTTDAATSSSSSSPGDTSGGDSSSSSSSTGTSGEGTSSTSEGADSSSGSSETSAGVEDGHAIAIGTGHRHTCIVVGTSPEEGGSVRCWGRAEWGRLGYLDDEDIGDDEAPLAAGLVNVGGPVVQIDGGWRHTCAVLATGGVRCWGMGLDGRLGYGNEESVGIIVSPASAGDVDVGGAAVSVGTGTSHTCALLETGGVRCWGWGVDGRLGYGNTESIGDDESPASAGDVDLGGVAIQLEVSDNHACALLEGGTVRCWGEGFSGVLGQGTPGNVGDNEVPADVPPIDMGGVVTKVVAGGIHNCALLDTGNVRCWGSGSNGALGSGSSETIGDNETPADAGDVDIGESVVDITAGRRHTCVRLETGAVRCWGRGGYGRLGYGNTDDVGGTVFSPVAEASDVDVGGVATQITAGEFHTCAIVDDGRVRCWGRSDFGQLGYGNTESIGDNEVPSSAGDVPAL